MSHFFIGVIGFSTVSTTPSENPMTPHSLYIRERRITWFTPPPPPFSKSVTTNVAHKLLKLLDAHFPKGTKLHNNLNRNSVKVSYSCMPNIDTLVKRHNTHVCARRKEDRRTSKKKKKCNCRWPSECPLSGIVYKTRPSKLQDHPLRCTGSTDTTFKARYGNHKASLTYAIKANQTELSKHVEPHTRSPG